MRRTLQVGNTRTCYRKEISTCVYLPKKDIGDFIMAYGMEFSFYDGNNTFMQPVESCLCVGTNTMDPNKIFGLTCHEKQSLEKHNAEWGKRWVIYVKFTEDKKSQFIELVKKFTKEKKLLLTDINGLN